jgi:Tol biopolymer transport system component
MRRKRFFAMGLVVSATLFASASAAAPTSGSRIAYYRNAAPCKTAGGDRVCDKGIWTSELDGTNERLLTPRKLGVGVPAWSDDGRRITYMAATGRRGVGEVWVMNENGSGKKRLAIEEPYYPEIVNGDGVSWSPDGTTVLVAAARLEKREGKTISTPVVLAVPVDGGRPRVLFTLPRGRYSSAVYSPQLSPNGKRIAFIYVRDVKEALYVSNPDGSARRRLTSAAAGQGRKLDWSPDGKRIVFAQRVVYKGSYNPELAVINPDGSGLRRLTRTEGTNNDLTPAWAPSGRQIIFNSTGLLQDEAGIENNAHRFAVINADGSGLHLVGPGRMDCKTPGPFADKGWCFASDPDWGPR